MPSVLWRCWLGGSKGIGPVKNWPAGCWHGYLICLQRGADLHMAQLMPLPLTVSCFCKIQIGFTFLVPAHLGSPGKRAVKCVCVCVCLRTGNVSVPIQLAQCRFPGWPFPTLKCQYVFRIKYNFIKRLSETVTIWNCQNADWFLRKKMLSVICYNFRHTFVLSVASVPGLQLQQQT